jgi:hypothetical protein
MSNGMTGGLPDPPLLGWRADLDLASPTRGLSHLDQAHLGLQKSVIGQPPTPGQPPNGRLCQVPGWSSARRKSMISRMAGLWVITPAWPLSRYRRRRPSGMRSAVSRNSSGA